MISEEVKFIKLQTLERNWFENICSGNMADRPSAGWEGRRRVWSPCATLVKQQEQRIVAALRKPEVLRNSVPRLLKWLHCNRTCHLAATVECEWQDLSPSTKDCCAIFPA